jgi:hypothetical protein
MRNRVNLISVLTLILLVVLPADRSRGQEVPFWAGDQVKGDANWHQAEHHRWAVMSVGGTGAIDRPSSWRPVAWNADASRWEGDSLADNAPTYYENDGPRLRGRSGGGKLVALVFDPGKPGHYGLSGAVKVNTWGPPGDVRVVLQRVGSEGEAAAVFDRAVKNRSTVDWSAEPAVAAVKLAKGERLALTFAGVRGGTAEMKLRVDGRVMQIAAVDDQRAIAQAQVKQAEIQRQRDTAAAAEQARQERLAAEAPAEIEPDPALARWPEGGYALPDDTGVVNVTAFGAKGDGKADDTQALRAAVRFALNREGRYGSPPFVYLPEGTYRVTGPIEGKVSRHGWSGGWRAGLILWGAGTDRTVIRLDDALPEYGTAAHPQYVLATGSERDERTKPGDEPLSGGGNRAFRHGIYHLTVDVGRSNPGAVGIDYVVSNRGAVKDVIIRSSDPDGVGSVGLNMTRNWPGPGLIKDVTVEGFDVGIATSHAQYSMTFENIVLRGQRVFGVRDGHAQALFFRNLKSDNQVPAFKLPSSRNLLVLLDSELTGGDLDQPAIVGGDAITYLRNVNVSGYGQTTDAGDEAPPVGRIEEFAHPAPVRARGERVEPLEIEESPEFWTDEHSQWANVVDFGATPGGDDDDLPGLQAAIDSGKPIVYLPNGGYRISEPLVVRGKTRLIIGMQSSIGLVDKEDPRPVVRIEDGDGPVMLEHLWLSGRAEHASSRAAAFRHVDLTRGYVNTEAGTGDVFFEDTIGKPLIIRHPQRFFGRQVNCEFGDEPLIENHGGKVWLLGYKTEGRVPVIANHGGTVELLGGLFYPLRKVPSEIPMIVNDGGKVRASYVWNGDAYPRVITTGTPASDDNAIVSHRDVKGRGAALLIDDDD